MSRKYGYESMDEILARLSVQSRTEEALRYPALSLASAPRRPIRAAVAATLCSLADRVEPECARTELVRQ